MKANEYPSIKCLTPSEIEIMGFEYFDKIRRIQKEDGNFITIGDEKFTIDAWQPFFVFEIYPCDEAFKVLTDYINQ